jgi:hypothetical protein
MRNARFWRLTTIVAAAGGLSLAGAGPALAGGAARADLGVSIDTASAFVQVGPDTLVRYGAPAAQSTATVSGSVTGIPAGLASVVVTLLAKPFGATAFVAVRGQQATLRAAADGSATYSFPVTPDRATGYEVTVSEAGAALKTSDPRTVYVIPDVTVTDSATTCARPTCTGTLTVTARIPAAAFAAESAKRLELYSGLREAPDRTPAGPARLGLMAAARHLVLNSAQGTVRYTFGYSFNIGPTEGYQWKVNYCTADTEAADGIGLPGPHGCGDQVVSASAPYLG